jgi:hypothetical protein
MMALGSLGRLTAEDVAREVVHAVTQPRHVLTDTIERLPAEPRRFGGGSGRAPPYGRGGHTAGGGELRTPRN